MRNRLTITALAVALALPATAARAVDLAGVQIHGFISQGFVQSTKQNNFPVTNSGEGSFNFNDFGLNFSKELTPALHVGLQLSAFDRGTYGKDKLTLDWAYGDYRVDDWLGLRAGKVKIPLGLYNAARDNDALRTWIFLPQQAYYDYERDSLVAILGGSVYGSVSLGAAGSLNYEVEVGTIPAVADGGFAQEIGGMMSNQYADLTITDISSRVSVAHSLEWRTPVQGLRLLATGLHTTLRGTALADPGTGASEANWKYDSLHRYIFSAEYSWNDLVLSGEYELDDYTLRVNYTDPTIPVSQWSSRQATDSWAVMASYRFTDWFELGGFYHEVYADRHHRDGSTFADFGMFAPYNMWWRDAAVTLRFDPVKNVVLKVEGHKIDGTYEIIQNFEEAKKDWWLFATKATFYF